MISASVDDLDAVTAEVADGAGVACTVTEQDVKATVADGM